MKHLRSEKGTALILTAVMMAAAVTLFALFTDGGLLFETKSKLQKSLDAAVLAGAQNLPARPDLARTQAQNTISANGESANVSIDFNTDYTSIHADSIEQRSILFSQALGTSQGQVHASAKVQLVPLTSGVGAIPLGVQSGATLTYGSQVQLKVGTASTGNFGALALTGPGASNYQNDLANGFSSELSVNNVLDTQTGNIAQPTRDAIQSRINSCPMHGTATYNDYPEGCPLAALVPVFQPIYDGGNQVKQVKITGFASFFIESVASTSDGAVVTGRFIQKTFAGSTSPAQASYGAFGVRLVE